MSLSLLLLVVFANYVENANILIIQPVATTSHHVMFEKIARGLANRGHQVDIVSCFLSKNPPQGYIDINIDGSCKNFTNNLSIQDVNFKTHLDTLDFILNEVGIKPCRAAFVNEELKKLRYSTKKYDLMMIEIFSTDCLIGFAHIFDVPVVGITSSVNLPWGSDRLGLPDNPSYIPHYFSGYSPVMTLQERIWNTVTLVVSKVMHYKSNMEIYKEAQDFFGQDLPSINELTHRTVALFVNSYFSNNQARPAVPGFIEVGGIHIDQPKPLEKHFKKLLETDSEGIIYLSMGSMVKTESFKIEKIQSMFDAFAELPYKVIWKAQFDKFPKGLKFAKNVHFVKWMPQLDILCSDKVKLFVSHGGLMGSQEAVYCGVPRLGIPFFADQKLNIQQAESMGQAIKVDYEELTKEKFQHAAKELLYNQKYAINAKKASELFKDRPMTPLETAVYWTEYIIRHNGAPHLKTASSQLSWYQYYLIDVIFILLFILLLTLFICITIVKLLYGLMFIKTKDKKD